MLKTHWPFALLLAVTVVFSVWSFIGAADRATWLFELLFVFIGVPVLVAAYPRFRFSAFAYLSCAAFVVILAFGARYTYESTPVFNWLRDQFHLARNYSDRVGHFFQGVIPALLARELIIRTSALGPGGWTAFFSVAIALAVSAFYELLEMWWVLLFYPGRGPEWLGMQGDPWDAQWDMTMALLGGLMVPFVLARWHDRSIAKVAALQRNPGPELPNP